MERSATEAAPLNVQAPVPSIRALQNLPEALTPVRHGFLWKRSRVFKTWLSRWYHLDCTSFNYAVSPKVLGSEARPVLPGPVREVLSLPPQRYTNGAPMYGMRVFSTAGAHRDLYTDDPHARDAWALDLSRSTPAARSFSAAAQLTLQPGPLPARPTSPRCDLRLSDVCDVDWSSMLGSGLFAVVLRGRLHGSGEAVAVKVVRAEAQQEHGPLLAREAMVWAAAGAHPHVAALRQVFRSRHRTYFIAELCEGGGLVERLASSATYCEREAAWLVRQLLAAVAHLHAAAIVHADIKPENVVLASRRDDSAIKLIDFSLASFFHTPTDPGGTPDFVAPEVLNEPERHAREGCGPEVDMWAVGVMLFFLLCGQTPFQAPSLDLVLQRVRSGEWAFQGRRWALVSEGARDLISLLLRRDPAARPSAAEALEHPWLRRPDALSQALLADAVAAFRAAASASATQQRNSWVKAASGEMLTRTSVNLSPHTSAAAHTSLGTSEAHGTPTPTRGSPGSFSGPARGPPSAAALGRGPYSFTGPAHPPGPLAIPPGGPHSPGRGGRGGGGRSRGPSPHHSPGTTPTPTCSPRSPLGMRARRASDTLAYTLALTERQESATQAAAQGLALPPPPSGLPYASAKLRRASDLYAYHHAHTEGSSLPAPGAGLDLGSPRRADSSESGRVASAHSAPPLAGAPPGGHSSRTRGASGLSVMTTAASLAAAAAARCDADGGRSSSPEPDPALMHLRSASSHGAPSQGGSSGDGTRAGSRVSWGDLTAQHPPRLLHPHTPNQHRVMPLEGTGSGQGITADAPFSSSHSSRHAVPGKSQSYNAMPSTWLDGHGRPTGRSPAGGTGLGASGPTSRRSSVSFTAGTSLAPLLMHHGPSPLSVSSGSRALPTAAVAAAPAGRGPWPTSAFPAVGAPQPRSGGSTSPRASPAAGSSGGTALTLAQQPPYSLVAVAGGSTGGAYGAAGSGSMYQAVLRSNLSGHGLISGFSGGDANAAGQALLRGTRSGSGLIGSARMVSPAAGGSSSGSGSLAAAEGAPVLRTAGREAAGAGEGGGGGRGQAETGAGEGLAPGRAPSCDRSRTAPLFVATSVWVPRRASDGWPQSSLQGVADARAADAGGARGEGESSACGAAQRQSPQVQPTGVLLALMPFHAPEQGDGGGRTSLSPRLPATSPASAPASRGDSDVAPIGHPFPRSSSLVPAVTAAAFKATPELPEAAARHGGLLSYLNVGAGQPLLGMAPGGRPPSRIVLETIPSEDPESLSGLIRSVGEDRAAANASSASPCGHYTSSIHSHSQPLHPLPYALSPLSHRTPHSPGPAEGRRREPASMLLSHDTRHADSAPNLAAAEAATMHVPIPESGRQPAAPVSPMHPASALRSASFTSPCGADTPAPALRGASSNSVPTKATEGHGLGGGGVDVGNVCDSVESARVRRPVRRAATASNLRLHATTAAAAQAAVAAAQAQALSAAGSGGVGFVRQHRASSAVASPAGSTGSLAALLLQAAPLARAALADAEAQREAAEAAAARLPGSGREQGGAAGLDVRRVATDTNLRLAISPADSQHPSAAASPISGPASGPGSGRASAMGRGSGGLAALLAQALPLAAAAQARAAVQAVSRAGSGSSRVSLASGDGADRMSPGSAPAAAVCAQGVPAAAGAGPSSRRTVARRSLTAADLRERLQAAGPAGGSSHRLAGRSAAAPAQQGGEAGPGWQARGGSGAGSVSSGPAGGPYSSAAAASSALVATGGHGSGRGLGGGGGAASPPRESAGSGGSLGSLSSRPSGGYRAAPSRLSNSGAGCSGPRGQPGPGLSGLGSGGLSGCSAATVAVLSLQQQQLMQLQNMHFAQQHMHQQAQLQRSMSRHLVAAAAAGGEGGESGGGGSPLGSYGSAPSQGNAGLRSMLQAAVEEEERGDE